MNPHSRTKALAGFTLVELIIVVSVLGILAALVIPKFTSATETARVSSTKDQLRSLRSALERYKFDHSGNYPPIDNFWDSLTGATDIDGTSNPAGDFGPYLMQPAVNPFTNSSTVVELDEGTSTDGWEYDTSSITKIYAVGFDESTGTYTAP